MTTQLNVMKQWLEALEGALSDDKPYIEKSKQAITALREALAEQPAQELLAWKNAAIRVGEELSSVGPNGYYNMTADQWLAWAMDQQPRGKSSLAEQPAPVAEPRKQEHVGWMCEDYDKHGKLQSKCIAMNPQRADPDNPLRVVKPLVFANSSPPAQRKPLTDEQIRNIWSNGDCFEEIAFARAIEAAHGIMSVPDGKGDA